MKHYNYRRRYHKHNSYYGIKRGYRINDNTRMKFDRLRLQIKRYAIRKGYRKTN